MDQSQAASDEKASGAQPLHYSFLFAFFAFLFALLFYIPYSGRPCWSISHLWEVPLGYDGVSQ